MKACSFIQKFSNTFKSSWSVGCSKTATGKKDAEINIFGQLSETRPYIFYILYISKLTSWPYDVLVSRPRFYYIDVNKII